MTILPDFPIPGLAVSQDVEDWILLEDEALKGYLKGLTVKDLNNPARPVGVWFGEPDEQVRVQSFPYITIDLLDISEDRERVQARFSEIENPPAWFPPENEDVSVRAWFPTPMNLVYQVTSWSRQPRHDRSILAQMSINRFHPQFAQIATSDGRTRRLTVQEFAKRDLVDESQKRLFRNVWTIVIKSEFFYAPLVLTERVTTVTINPSDLVQLPNVDVSPNLAYP